MNRVHVVLFRSLTLLGDLASFRSAPCLVFYELNKENGSKL